jgi:hypothetical protein
MKEYGFRRFLASGQRAKVLPGLYFLRRPPRTLAGTWNAIEALCI